MHVAPRVHTERERSNTSGRAVFRRIGVEPSGSNIRIPETIKILIGPKIYFWQSMFKMGTSMEIKCFIKLSFYIKCNRCRDRYLFKKYGHMNSER